MPEVVYTLGYQQRSIDEFVELALGAGVQVLIDVRETPWSHKKGFSKAALSAALAAVGIEYVHAKFAGNPKSLRRQASDHAECLEWYAVYLEENAAIVDAFEQLMAGIIAQGKRAALTCFERHADDCHRSILAEKWAARGRQRDVAHLAIEGCPRMLPA